MKPAPSSLRLGICLVAVALVASACGGRKPQPAAGSATTAGAQALRIAVATNYPPLAFREDGVLKGIEVEFANELESALGRPVQLVETEWEQLIPSLRDGRVDVVMSGLSITPERQKHVDFCASYMQVGQMAMFHRRNQERARQPDAMNQRGVRVGFGKETTGELYARRELKRARLEGFDSVDSGVAALREGRLDYFLYDAPAVWRITGGFGSPEKEITSLFEPLTVEHLAWAVRKGDRSLRQTLNQVLARWKVDGTHTRVLSHWIRVHKRAMFLEARQ